MLNVAQITKATTKRFQALEEAPPIPAREDDGKYSTLRRIRLGLVQRNLTFVFRSTLSKSRSKLFPSKTKEKEEEVLDVHTNTNTTTNNNNGPKTPILDGYKENTTVEENDDEDFGSFSYDEDPDEYFSESDVEVSERRGGAEEKKYSRLEKFRRSRSRSRSPSRSLSRSRSRSESKSCWEEEEAEAENVRRGGTKSGRSETRTSSAVLPVKVPNLGLEILDSQIWDFCH